MTTECISWQWKSTLNDEKDGIPADAGSVAVGDDVHEQSDPEPQQSSGKKHLYLITMFRSRRLGHVGCHTKQPLGSGSFACHFQGIGLPTNWYEFEGILHCVE